MKTLTSLFILLSVLLSGSGCLQQEQIRIHNIPDEEVLKLLPPSAGEIVEVEEGKKFSGHLMKLPIPGKWQTITLANLACTVDLPNQPIQAFSMNVIEQDDFANLLLYPVFQGSWGVLEVVTINIVKLTPESIPPNPDEKWELMFHDKLDVVGGKWMSTYRKDITLKNKNILRITGLVRNKYSIRKTGKPLFPEMDKLTRKVIESITPVE